MKRWDKVGQKRWDSSKYLAPKEGLWVDHKPPRSKYSYTEKGTYHDLLRTPMADCEKKLLLKKNFYLKRTSTCTSSFILHARSKRALFRIT